MKKNTLTTLYNYLVKHDDSVDLSLLVEDIRDEYEHMNAKRQANQDIYTIAHDVLMGALTDKEQTSKELFEHNEWPDGFTQGKLNYALRAMWADEVCKIDNGKSANTYKRK